LFGDVATAADPTLPQLAEAQGRYMGGEITANLLSNPTVTTLAGAQFDMITPGNEMKWDTVEPNRNQFNFAPADRIVSQAKAQGMKIRGHTLVWYQQLAPWVGGLDANNLRSAMLNHIAQVAGHWKGQVIAWDVVNEAFEENGTRRQATHGVEVGQQDQAVRVHAVIIANDLPLNRAAVTLQRPAPPPRCARTDRSSSRRCVLGRAAPSGRRGSAHAAYSSLLKSLSPWCSSLARAWPRRASRACSR